MARRSSRKRKSPTGFFTVILVLAAAAGFGYWITTTKMSPVPPVPDNSSVGVGHTDKVVLPRHKRVKIYVVNMEKGEPKLVAENRRVPEGTDPHTSALESLIAPSDESDHSRFFVPAGTQLRGLEVKDGIAYADFSREIMDNINGSTTNEALLVNSIVHTLTQFKDVKKVQILVEGKRVDSLAGQLDISGPISDNSTMLGEGVSE